MSNAVSGRSPELSHEAMVDINKAIDLAPKNPNFYMNRAMILGQALQYAAAIADLTKAMEFAPRSVLLRNMRGFMYMQVNDQANAQEDFQTARLLGAAAGQ
jgi:Flp pilus assembly protein TadD